MRLFGNMEINNGELLINDFSMTYLKEKYDTPLYIIDEKDFVNKCREFSDNFKSEDLKTEILYASKALLNVYIAKIIDREGLSIDVVSGGELYTALKAGIDPKRVYFHGNNKSLEELKYAIENKIGHIVIDNEEEVNNLLKLLKDRDCVQNVMLRVNPGIEAHTHEYIKTTKNDSKFGVSIFDETTTELVHRIVNSDKLSFSGFHAHIGSQVFEEDSFLKEAEVMLDYTKTMSEKLHINIPMVNLGGGFGAYYSSEDKPFDLGKFLQKYIKFVEDYNNDKNIGLEKVLIEPGRSLIANSGSTLYTVGAVKKTYGKRNYIFVDGGMTDNIRPALYQAKHEAALTSKMDEDNREVYTIAGKCCESGDVLIKDISLPEAEAGDLLLITSTGAYNYSMSSNYNRIGRPAMVFLSETDNLAVKRETFEDIIKNDVL